MTIFSDKRIVRILLWRLRFPGLFYDWKSVRVLLPPCRGWHSLDIELNYYLNLSVHSVFFGLSSFSCGFIFRTPAEVINASIDLSRYINDNNFYDHHISLSSVAMWKRCGYYSGFLYYYLFFSLFVIVYLYFSTQRLIHTWPYKV